MNILKINLKDVPYKFDVKAKTLTIPEFVGPFPNLIKIYSHHTGKTLTFVLDEVKAMQNEFWEASMYFSTNNRCKHLVLTRW